MEKERKILLDVMSHELIRKDMIHIMNNIFLKNPKSARASEEARKKGNALLQHKKHDAQTHKAIFSHYCESIALAPNESQKLAFAYGNRSSFLLHIHKYEECIKDIDRVLTMTISDFLRAKLLCRKARCLKKLGSSNISSILEMVQNLIDNIDGQDKIKLTKMVDAVKSTVVNNTKKAEISSNEIERINGDELPLTDDYSSRVSIEYSEKYGQYLVAAKDYKPGDVIFVEKLYASVFVEGSSLLSCDYCLKLVWSSVPCSYCDWSMYCSDSCKEKAWNEYHDIECSTVSHMKQGCRNAWKLTVMPLRVLITAIKESGNITKLKKALDSVDQCADVSSKGFFKNGQVLINSIKNVYSLDSYAPHDALTKTSAVVPLILISLTKYSKLKDNFNVKQLEDLEKNEDIMFLGSLLIKIIAVLNCNAYDCSYDKRTQKQSEIVHFDDRRCLSTLFSLINHSCFPTASWRYTEGNNLLVFATRPIQKNSQIFVSYGYRFEDDIQSIRQDKLLKKYNFRCDCEACVKGWPTINILEDKNLDKKNYFANRKVSIENLMEVCKLLQEGGQLDKSHMEKLSLSITQCDNWKQPSPIFYAMSNLLRLVFTAIYSPKSLLFDECD